MLKKTNQIIDFNLKIRPQMVEIAGSEKRRFQNRAGTSQEYASTRILSMRNFACCVWVRSRYFRLFFIYHAFTPFLMFEWDEL
jgi:hypothetical protein